MTTRTTMGRAESTPRSSWRKSSRSSGDGSTNCVEVRAAGQGFEIRDSKLGDSSPVFGLPTRNFLDLVACIKTGEIE